MQIEAVINAWMFDDREKAKTLRIWIRDFLEAPRELLAFFLSSVSSSVVRDSFVRPDEWSLLFPSFYKALANFF